MVDVKARLVVEDAASGVLGTIRQGFDQLLGSSEQATQGMGFFQQSMASLTGNYLPQLVRGVTGYATSLLDAARAGDSADQALGGFIAAVQGKPFAEARKEAEQLGDVLDNMAITAGQPIGEVGDAFTKLVEITGATSEGIELATQQMQGLVTIANVLGKNTGAISQEYAFMADGMLRSRGAMAQLLQKTGIFGDDMRKASAGWAKLTEEERIRRLTYGITQITEQFSEAAPTFDDLVNTVKNVKEMALEKFGEPIMAALKPELINFTRLLRENTGLIEEYAKLIAQDLKVWVQEGASMFRDGLKYLHTHHEQIKSAIVEAFAYAKSVVEFIIAHKEILAIAFGAKTVLPAVQGAVHAGQAVVAAGKPLYGLGAAGTGAMGGLAGAGGLTGAAGGIVALGAAAAALVGVGLAADQASKLMGELSRSAVEEPMARLKALDELQRGEAMFTKGSDEMVRWIDRMADATARYADQLDMTVESISLYADALKEKTETRAMIGSSLKEGSALADITAEGQSESFLTAQQVEKNVATMSKIVTDSWALASNMNDEGAKQYIAKTLMGSKALADSFIKAADWTTEGYTALLEAVTKGGGEMSDFAKQLRGLAGEAGRMEKPKFNLNMNGGQTFKITQEFRDADPDRIALVFRRDLVAAAERRIGSNYSSPFGT